MPTANGTGSAWSNISVCHTNDFGDKTSSIPGWLRFQGGACSRSILPGTTHLVSSKEAWKDKVPLVQEALRNPQIEIVSFDWLEDSLMSKSHRPKKMTKPYRWSVLENTAQQIVQQRKRVRAKKVDQKVQLFEKRCNDIFKDIEVANYHIFYDPTGFDYTITLSQHSIGLNTIAWQSLKVSYLSPIPSRALLPSSDSISPSTNTLPNRHQLCESNATPPSYFVYVKRSPPPPSRKPLSNTLTPVGVPFDQAVRAFKAYFRKCTGIDWEARMDGSPSSGDGAAQGKGGALWMYRAPDTGETVGLLPPGKEHLQPKRKWGVDEGEGEEGEHAERERERKKAKAKAEATGPTTGFHVRKTVGWEKASARTGVKEGMGARTSTGKVWMGSRFDGTECGGGGASGNSKMIQLIEID